MNPLAELVLSFLVVAGAVFCFLGSLGLVRFPDFYMRLHGPSKATTLGIGALIAASLGAFALAGQASPYELLIGLFLALTTPVSAHLLARAARHRGVPARQGRDGAAPASAQRND